MVRGRERRFLMVLLGGLALGGWTALWGQSSFSRGEDFFLQNKPEEALPFLEVSVIEDPLKVRAFFYLGMAYLQLGRFDDSIGAYLRILPQAGDDTARIAYNLGNVYFAKGDVVSARRYYTQSIEADPAYASAYLNRANTLIWARELRDAVKDYETYLSMEPRSLQRPQIEGLVFLIRQEFAEEERRLVLAAEQARVEEERRLILAAEQARVEEERRRVLAAEQARLAAEQARLAAEQARLAEERIRLAEEQRQRLLEEVSASLQSAADEIRGVSSGSEDVQGYEGEFELE